jgi:hypothetical protein
MSSWTKSAEPPFAAEGGLPAPYRVEDDAYTMLDDLMVAVEAFCPSWPPRDYRPGKKMLL